MAERLAYLEAVVGADVTQFRRGMRDIRNEVGFLSETVRGITGVGRSLTLAYTTPVLALGTAAIGVASEFQASMANINAIAGLTSDELDALGQRTLEFGSRTRAGANAASDALYTVFSAGLTNVEDAFGAMEVATYTAEAGLADMTTTTETLIAVMLSYGDTSEEAAWRTSDAITQMVAVGVGSMEQFSTALSSVIPTAAAAGMEFDELAADMAFLTQRGLSASRAGVSLNAAIEQMVNPTQAMQGAFAELGARGLPDLIDQFGSVNGAIAAVIETADGDMTNLFEMFNSRQARRAVGLFATDLEGWNAAIEEFQGGVEGATMRAWEQQMASFAASWDLLISAVEAAGIAIGQTLFPVLQPIIDGLTDIILGVVDLSPELLGMGAAFVTVTAAIPPLIWLLGSLLSPFGLILGAVSALGVAFATNFGGIADEVSETVTSIIANVQPMIDIFDDMWATIFPEMAVEDFIPVDSLANPFDTITVDRPSSLWEIYEANGYDELFTWDEFIAEATAGGWEGGVIDVGDYITIENSMDIGGAPNPLDGLKGVDGGKDAEHATDDFAPLETMWDRVETAIEDAIPRIQTQLGNLWDTFTTWLDDKGSQFIDGMASWFTVGNGTGFYDALTAFLTGDFEGAINAIIPNLGTTLATAMGNWDLSAAFPQISASLSTLFTNIGDWLLTTGIPIFSQSAGFLAGRIGVILSDAIAAGFAWFTSGGAADVGSYLDDGIIDPFMAGFEDATAGSDIANGMDTMLADFETMLTDLGDNLTALADLVGLDVTWDVLTDIGDAVGDFWNSVSSADTSGLLTLGMLAVLISGTLFSAMVNLVNTTGAAFADGIRAMGDGIAYFMDGISAAASGDWLGAMQNLGGAFVNLAFALLQIPAGIFDWFINGINTLLGMDIGSVSDWLNDFRVSLNEGFDGSDNGIDVPLTMNPRLQWTGQAWNDAVSSVEATDILVDSEVELSLQASGINLDIGSNVWNSGMVTGLEMPEEIVWDEELPELVADVNDLRFSTNADEREVGENLWMAILQGMNVEDANAFIAMSNYEPVVSIDGVTYVLTDEGYQIEMPDTITTNEDTEVTTTGNVTVNAEGTVDANTDSATSIAPVDLSTASTAFAEQFAEGQDATAIIDEQLIPLQEAWNVMFSPDGTMAVNFATFATEVSNGWTGIQTAINDTTDTMNVDLAAAITTFTGNKDTLVNDMTTVKDAISEAEDKVRGLIGAIESLLAIDGSLSVDVSVSSTGTEVDGSHKTGLSSVPYDGYIAELHKDEMVLTKSEANDYRRGNIPTDVATGGGSSRNSNNTNNTTLNINTTMNFEDIIREAKRRGIPLK